MRINKNDHHNWLLFRFRNSVCIHLAIQLCCTFLSCTVFWLQHKVFLSHDVYLRLAFFCCRIIEGEVFLAWDGGEKLKAQKDLAKGAKLGVKDDIKILDYYR